MKGIIVKPAVYKTMMVVLALAMGIWAVCPSSADARLKTRIAVLPFYVELGMPAERADSGLHYRRMSGFIENHLFDHGFEVVDPFARDAFEREYDRVMERAKRDSMTLATNLCQRYGTDAVYIIWLKVKTVRTPDGYVRASALMDGKGYDSAGRSLGANLLKTLKVTRREFEVAVAEVEKEMGDEVGRVLTRWREQGQHHQGMAAARNQGGAGILAQGIEAQSGYLTIRLSGAADYELVEAFGKVLLTTRGVAAARQQSMRIVPDSPQMCITEWMVEIDQFETDSFRLQANVMKMVKDILDAGGTLRLKGIPYRYTPGELRLMTGLMPGEATTRTLKFVVDHGRARQRWITQRSGF